MSQRRRGVRARPLGRRVAGALTSIVVSLRAAVSRNEASASAARRSNAVSMGPKMHRSASKPARYSAAVGACGGRQSGRRAVMRSLSAVWRGRVAVLIAWERGTKAVVDAVDNGGAGASVVVEEEDARGGGGEDFVVATMTEGHALVGGEAGDGMA